MPLVREEPILGSGSKEKALGRVGPGQCNPDFQPFQTGLSYLIVQLNLVDAFVINLDLFKITL